MCGSLLAVSDHLHRVLCPKGPANWTVLPDEEGNAVLARLDNSETIWLSEVLTQAVDGRKGIPAPVRSGV